MAGSALVVSENYYPGWRATSGGAELPVYRANYTLMGIPLTAGATEIDLRFESAPYETGKAITLFATALALVLAGFGVVRERSTVRG